MGLEETIKYQHEEAEQAAQGGDTAHGTDEETEATTKGGDTARSEIKGTEEEKNSANTSTSSVPSVCDSCGLTNHIHRYFHRDT